MAAISDGVDLKDVKQSIQELETQRSQLPVSHPDRPSINERLVQLEKQKTIINERLVLLEKQKTILVRKNPESDNPWEGKFLYSTWLAKEGLVAPHEQYGLYASCLGGLGFMARSFWRANMLMKSAHEPDPVKAKELRLFARATAEQVEYAALYASRLRTRGVLVAVGAPILWIGYISAKYAKIPLQKA